MHTLFYIMNTFLLLVTFQTFKQFFVNFYIFCYHHNRYFYDHIWTLHINVSLLRIQKRNPMTVLKYCFAWTVHIFFKSRTLEPILYSIYYFEKIIIKWLCLHKLAVNRSNGKVYCHNVVLTAPTSHLVGAIILLCIWHIDFYWSGDNLYTILWKSFPILK